MKFDSYARYALMGALAISLACARNTEDTDETTSGRVTPSDTGTTVRVKPDTTAMDTVGKAPMDTLRPPADTGMHHPGADTVRAGSDTSYSPAPVRPGATDSARTGAPPDSSQAAPGWPKDSSGSGWSTPPDSGR